LRVIFYWSFEEISHIEDKKLLIPRLTIILVLQS
jgi:hypothetical protein